MENNLESKSVNQDSLAGKWKQMRGDLKSWWGKLTDDDLEWIGGQKDKLIGSLQERYGYTRERAQEEIERRFQEYSDKEPVAALPLCRPRHESSVQRPLRRPTRRHPLSETR